MVPSFKLLASLHFSQTLMKIIDLEKVESQLGDLVNMAQTGAVAVRERDGRVTVLLPMKEYEHFARLGDVY